MPDTVGDGDDFSAEASGLISAAAGSFESVTGVSSETGNIYTDDCSILVPNASDTFSLQLNANTFNTTTCNGAANPSACQGWQQFVFSNDQGLGSVVYMQYWLLNYGTTCPAGWYQFDNYFWIDCYSNSNATAVPTQTIANMNQLSLTGNASTGGNDTVVLSTEGDEMYSVAGDDSVLNLAQGWQAAEFNIFGDGCGSEASFNDGSTIVVRTSLEDGTTNAPFCVDEGFTGETNSLTLVNPCSVVDGGSPAIVFTENSTGESATPTPTVTPTAAATATPTATPTATVTPTATPTPIDEKMKITPKTLAFGKSVTVGTTSKAKKVTIKNAGNKKTGLMVDVESESASSPFAVTSECDQMLSPGRNCKVSVTFSPTDTTRQTATLMIYDNVIGEPQSVALTGTGKDPKAKN